MRVKANKWPDPGWRLQKDVTLSLNRNDALDLYLLFIRIGGSPFNSGRRTTDKILEALRKAFWLDKLGERTLEREQARRFSDNASYIHFRDGVD